MDLETLKERIENLDPLLHRALRDALLAEYHRRVGQAQVSEPRCRTGGDPFEDAFKKAANDIGERYVRGTDDYVREHHPDLYARTEEADKRMNELWTAGRQGKATIDQFREALNEWYLLHLKGIEIYVAERLGTKREMSE
jgi:hypothetical protein